MDQMGQLPLPGLMQLNIKKSFKLGIRSLLTTCSKEDFSEAFPSFTRAEQEGLHQLYIQVITSLHGNIEEEFESLCLETQVGTVLDTIEQLVEERNINPLFADKTNIGDVQQELSRVKEDEVQHLMGMLESAAEQNRLVRARIESLKKERQDLSTTVDAVDKLRSWSLNYGHISRQWAP
ncbi:hypothetical protein HHK36_000877 [Tetracentron sinense]|uniref:Uncharacterized protein n=1 Tax=Tetracentron sinense TaxID=13715 RepID=A0A834ZW91_TETSI|nr:hypothetical protein HHK36_000877 [Tetracentron sinense]